MRNSFPPFNSSTQGAVASLADVSQNLSEMNHEFDKINEVCSTAYLRGKLHEAETLKIDIETVLFERVRSVVWGWYEVVNIFFVTADNIRLKN